MQVKEKALKISELITELEKIKNDSGDCEVWMSNKDGKEGDSIYFDSISRVVMFMVADNNYKAVMLLPGKEYLKL